METRKEHDRDAGSDVPPLKPGWYVFVAMNATDKTATDKHGPFESRADIEAWLKEWHIEFRPNAMAYDRAVLYFGEMTADESESPWATAIHHIG